MIRLPSLIQALLLPAKLTVDISWIVLSRCAICASGAAAYSPMPYMASDRVAPASATGQAKRQIDMPDARVTTSSLPAARLPSPISAPIIAPIGNSSKACCGRLNSVKSSAPVAV